MAFRRFADRLLPFAVGCLVALGIGWTLVHIDHNRSAEVNTCQQVQKLSGAIQATLKQTLYGGRTQKPLGQPGSVGYAYYREHPAELVSSRLQLWRQIAQFAPKHCN